MGDFQQKAAKRDRDVKSHLVFTPLGTKSHKDQVGAKPEAAPSAYGSGRIPAVIFAHWREALNQAALSPPARGGYALGLTAYLEYCRRNGLSVTLESARGFMADAERRQLARNPQLWKEALNWFFREGRQHSGLPSRGMPTPGQADTGRTPWERRLIERLRLSHYSWRTEQTYREWAWRFAQFMGQRELESATGEDLKAFLSQLAVKGRVSAATQKQALNALVFLFREGLGSDPGDLSGYALSRRGARVPTVLSRQECQRLFAALPGTTRLMAELMYGSGLRLTELLRLRVKDADLERRQVVVRAGKGDKDRVTVLPVQVSPIRAGVTH